MNRFSGSRRRIVRGLVAGSGLLAVPGALANALERTPRQTQGPFYPDRLPLDRDNDLLIVNDALTPANGEVTHLSGRVLDLAGEPVRNIEVEIWQADAAGVYLHSGSAGSEKRDGNFQGYGRFSTGGNGEYYFRTIRPVPYPGRTPHIHFALNRGDQRLLTTQMYVRGEPRNARDGLFRSLKPAERDRLLADFRPREDSRAAELEARFDIVIGRTPEDPSKDFFRRRA